MANDGMARPMFTTDTATSAPRRTCPSTTAGGMADGAAIRMAPPRCWMWAQVRAGSPLRPDQAASLCR